LAEAAMRRDFLVFFLDVFLIKSSNYCNPSALRYKALAAPVAPCS
jgi:hypothetical protein